MYNTECMAVHYIHGFCNGNAAAVVQEYRDIYAESQGTLVGNGILNATPQ
jgi:hypothetical protein